VSLALAVNVRAADDARAVADEPSEEKNPGEEAQHADDVVAPSSPPPEAAAPSPAPIHEARPPLPVAPYPPPMRSAPEMDPFRNARGFNAIFSRSKGPPLWPFFLGAIVIIAFIGVRIELASRQAEEHDISRQLDFELAKQRQSEPSIPDILTPKSRSLESVTASARKVCKRITECSGGTNELVEECVSRQMAPANDPLARAMVGQVLDDVIASCGNKPCSEYVDCYMSSLGQMAEAAGASTASASEADSARISALVCELGRDSPGHVPDLHAPNASPKARELDALLDKVGPVAASRVLRDAVKQCGTDEPMPSAGSSSSRQR
jgi:hypothetical protein